jgi:hypothetical protein
MSPRLTLLFVCDPVASRALFISSFSAAGFQVLVVPHTEDAKTLLASFSVDAIAVWDDGIRARRPNGSELRLASAGAPIILFRDREQAGPHPLGIDSVCHVDSDDEILVRAAAVFFRQSLVASHSHDVAVMPDKSVRRRLPDSETQIAV